ncbi:MAG: type IX secretion system sortase PorU [Bacteroidales bacterium]|nr:type IX secretion system sortase PorU [Bacteroidales bacterium]MCF8337376.1 type IX secretion system sortase PorU [Bacteroidales bacterium]
MKYGYTLYIILLIFISLSATGQYGEKTITLDWTEDPEGRRILFQNGVASGQHPFLQKYSHSIELSGSNNGLLAFLEVSEEIPCAPETKRFLNQIDLAEDYRLNYGVAKQHRQPIGYANVTPFRKGKNGTYYKLKKFTLSYIKQEKKAAREPVANQYADESVLASGKWHKISVDSTGIYKLDFEDLSQMGFSMNELSSSKIHLHGRPGGLLPERVDDFRYDDLPEIAIKVKDGGDGTFDSGDYLLFFGQSPHTWSFNNSTDHYQHRQHTYSDKHYYFVTLGTPDGKRISTQDEINEDADQTITTYDALFYHEKDKYNLLNSGRHWMSEKYDLETTRQYTFDLTNRVGDEPVYFKGRFVARSTARSTFTINAGSESQNLSIPSISLGYNKKYAQDKLKTFTFSPTQNTLNIEIHYNKTNSSSIGWLDYLELNARKTLTLYKGQMYFRDRKSVSDGDIGRFEVSYNNQQPEIWEVTRPIQPQKMVLENANGKTSFKVQTDSLREFIAFDGTTFLEPELEGNVENQNLHGLTQGVNYIILTSPSMREEAERLASFHRSNSDLSVRTVNINKVYNEFSGGGQDITAIRDFFKMLYDRWEGTNELQYALMFGDGSFDYKDIIEENTNVIPTYQSRNSLHPVSSYATDDYFGYLDPGEGDLTNDRLDIGLGRLPIATPDQAAAAVDKIIRYGCDSLNVLGDWRNHLTFIGDDEDNNSHANQANQLAESIKSNHPEYNVQKIFFDAYQQESTPGGKRYPDVNEAINTRVEQGGLIINYTGHGGEVGWAHERVLGMADIENWNNRNNLPVFITATCEFTRFDDPELTSAGERIFLRENAGGIALFTTTRATYGNPNFALNQNFYNHAFSKSEGEYRRMGDLIRLSKAEHNSGNNGRKFILIGDPALKMAYPEHNAVLTQVNDQPVDATSDTLKALSEISMSGEIRDFNDQLKSDFNGVIYPTVYDKEVTVTTLANDNDSYPMDFDVRKNILYKGKANVDSGKFSYTFVVPKDIDYNIGQGKISLYAASENQTDANGYFKDIMVGGFDESAQTDNQGPEIELFIDDSTFKPGGITDSNPVLHAKISDENGINTVGNGIGHDIIAYIDKKANLKVLNNYYVADLNRYNQGTVTYPFFNVPDGEHTLYLKAWDVYNNSSTATLNFVVASQDDFKIQRLFNFPNPVTDHTNFVFEHNQKNKELEIKLRIFNSYGQLVNEINKTIFADGYKISPISWDGKNSYGTRLKKGVYISKITVKNKEGKIAEKSNKLLLIR